MADGSVQSPVMSARLRRKAVNVEAMRQLAKGILPKPVFDFVDGAAQDERTLRRNQDAFADIRFMPRPLSGMSSVRDQSLELFGKRIAMPLLICPTGLTSLIWPKGELHAARAAKAAGTIYTTSHASSRTLEEIAQVGASPRWMQLGVYHDLNFYHSAVRRAAASGYDALVLTLDSQIGGVRERDMRNGFTLPPRFGIGDAFALLGKLPWLMRVGRDLSGITHANLVEPGKASDVVTLSKTIRDLQNQNMRWSDIDAVRAIWKGPLLLKGVLHPAEATEALNHGIDGLIVSNHGGRQLDGAVSTIEALPGIVQAVNGRVPVLLDGGVRRGTDVVKAIALGATACMIGRPQIWGLAVAGEAGLSHVLDLFRREIDVTMGLLGVASSSELSRDRLFNNGGTIAPSPAAPLTRVMPLSATGT